MLNFYFGPLSVCVSEISLYTYDVDFPDPVGSKLTCVTMLYIRTIKPVFPTSVSLQWDGVSPWRQGEDWMQLVVSLLSEITPPPTHPHTHPHTPSHSHTLTVCVVVMP